MAKEVKEGEDGADDEPPLVVVEEKEQEAKAAKALAEDDDDDGDEPDKGADERVGKGREGEAPSHRVDPNETDEQRRERRKAEKVAKKQRRNAAITRDRTERAFLEQRNETLERRLLAVERGQVSGHVIQVEGRIGQVESQLREANEVLAAAVDAGAGADVVKVTEIRDALNEQLRQLKGYKEHLAKGGKPVGSEASEEGEGRQPQRRERTAPPPKDPKIAANSRRFQESLEWFDPNAKDADSAVVYTIDLALAGDTRFDPRTKKYWAELERRVKAALPHRFEDDDLDDDDDDDDDDEPAPRNGGKKPGGGPRLPSGSERGTRGSNTFYISAERKQAMIDAGVWDDPKLKAKYVKKYKEWDEQNARQH